MSLHAVDDVSRKPRMDRSLFPHNEVSGVFTGLTITPVKNPPANSQSESNRGKRISPAVVRDAWNTAVSANPADTIACVAAWRTDFREDLPKIDIRCWSCTALPTGSCRSRHAVRPHTS